MRIDFRFIFALILSGIPLAAFGQAGDVVLHTGVPVEEVFPNSINIAHAELGGVLSTNAEPLDDPQYRLEYINDGLSGDVGANLNPSSGWAAEVDPEKPADLVVSFHDERQARIAGFAITTWRWTTTLASRFEVFVSNSGRDGPWEEVGESLGMVEEFGPQSFRFESPVTATHMLFRLYETPYASTFHLAEIEVFEAPASETSPSIIADFRANLVAPGLGGALIRFSAPSGGGFVDTIIDGDVTTAWVASGNEPRRITAAFKDNKVALVEEIELVVPADADQALWPSRIAIEVSQSNSPAIGFEPAGESTLQWDGTVARVRLASPTLARYLRLTINPGADVDTALAELRVFEPIGSGYQPVYVPGRVEPSGAKRPSRDSSTFVTNEAEPNDLPSQARPLLPGDSVAGILVPRTDIDRYLVDADQALDTDLHLTVETLSGVAANMIAVDAEGQKYDLTGPNSVKTGGETKLVLPMRSYEVEIARASTSNLVLVFDNSGSMRDRVDDLYAAATEFINQKRDDEDIALVKFAAGVEQISDFSTDAAELATRLEGSLVPAGDTALYDGLIAAIEALQGREGDRGIVLISDGANTAGNASVHDAWRVLEESGIRLYAIGLGDQLDIHASVTGLGSTPNRLLDMWSRFSGGSYFRAPTSDQLADVYQQISAEIREGTRYRLRADLVEVEYGALQVVATAGILPGENDPVIELILDASGSMREQKRKIDGRLKIDVAKDTLIDVVNSLPESAVVGLRTYGHRVREGEEYDCVDVELVHPHQRLDREALIGSILSINPLGTTPIYTALLFAWGDLKELPEGPKLVVLVTDGKAECREPGEIVGLARTLKANGFDLRVNVVGFALADLDTKAVMTEVAEATDGRFFDAQDAESLSAAIRQSFGDVAYEVLDANGDVVATAKIGDETIRLRADSYGVRVLTAGQPLIWDNVAVGTKSVTVMDVQRTGNETLAFFEQRKVE